MNQQLLDYVRQQLAAGVSKDDLFRILAAQGLSPHDIDGTFNSVSLSVAPASITSKPQIQEPPLQPKKRHRILRIFVWSIGSIVGLVALLLLTPSVLGLFFKDISPTDYSDLNLPTLSVPDNQNALPDITAAANATDKTYDTGTLRDILAGKTWDNAFAAQAIASNTPALVLLGRAAEKPTFQDPGAGQPDTLSLKTILPFMGSWRTLIRFNGLAALYLARNGKGSEGVQTALVGVNVAQKIEMSQGFLIQWLVGIAMKNQALQSMQGILASSTISTNDLKSLATSLKQYTNDGSGLVKAHKIDFYSQKSMIEYLAHRNVKEADPENSDGFIALSSAIDRTNFYFHPHQSISFLADDIRLRVVSAQASCDVLQEHEPKKVGPSNIFLFFFTPNAIGKVIHDVNAATADSASVKRCNENTLLEATRLLTGLKAFRQDKGLLPGSLDELVPTYLDDMPLDPFSGHEFKYDQIKRIIYSVGQEKLDLGGSTGDNGEQMKNPTFSF